jgi:hypothetical protein
MVLQVLGEDPSLPQPSGVSMLHILKAWPSLICVNLLCLDRGLHISQIAGRGIAYAI